MQPIRNQSQVVLGKEIDDLIVGVGRHERNSKRANGFITGESIAAAPDDFIPIPERKPVLDIDVGGVARFRQHALVIPVGPVKIGANGQFGVAGEPMAPG